MIKINFTIPPNSKLLYTTIELKKEESETEYLQERRQYS